MGYQAPQLPTAPRGFRYRRVGGTAAAPSLVLERVGLGFWPFDSSEDQAPSPDVLALNAQRDAARALANARVYGSASDVSAAQTALTQAQQGAASTYGAELATDTAPSFLDKLLGGLQTALTAPAKAAAIGLGIIGIIVLGPPLLNYMTARRRSPNPRRRRSRRRRG